MDYNIKLLVLDPDPTHAEELAQKFMPVVPFFSHKVVISIQDALEEHLASPFEVCLISSNLDPAVAELFLSDMRVLYSKSREKICAFIGVHQELPENFDMNAAIVAGYNTVVSENFDAKDREKITIALGEFMHLKQVDEHISDVEWTMKMLLAEVDRVSIDRRRGRESKFNMIASDFAANIVEFDAKILDKYFEELTEQTEKAVPGKAQIVRIPKDVLQKNLPKLMNDRYSGASRRVWKKLLKRYGVSEDEKL